MEGKDRAPDDFGFLQSLRPPCLSPFTCSRTTRWRRSRGRASAVRNPPASLLKNAFHRSVVADADGIAGCVGDELFRHATRDLFGMGEQQFLELADVRKFAPSGSVSPASTGRPRPYCQATRYFPIGPVRLFTRFFLLRQNAVVFRASRRSRRSFRERKPGGSMREWQPAQFSVLRCFSRFRGSFSRRGCPARWPGRSAVAAAQGGP